MRLPEGLTPAHFNELRVDLDAWRPAVVEICARHQVECGVVTAFGDGSNLVADVDDRWVVKIFPPFHAHQFESERRVLAYLQGHDLPLQVPSLIAEGPRDDGWSYVILEKLQGELLELCWGGLRHDDKVRILTQLGATMAAVHRLALGDLESLPPDWTSFIRGQSENCRARHTRLGAPMWLLEGLTDLLRDWGGVEPVDERVILTGEYTPFNLLVQRDEAGWRLTGMIDLGDAMVGSRDYDFLGPSLFSCAGDPRLVAALFQGYYGERPVIDRNRRMRLVALALMHRYSNLDAQLRIARWRERADSIDSLAELIWPPETK